jgi:hypothetical protein
MDQPADEIIWLGEHDVLIRCHTGVEWSAVLEEYRALVLEKDWEGFNPADYQDTPLDAVLALLPPLPASEQSDGRARAYQVGCSQDVVAQVKEFCSTLTRPSQEEIARAMHATASSLCSDPLSFAEPAFPLPGHGMEVYFALQAPVMVIFAIDAPRHTIYLHSVRLIGEKLP